MQLDFDKAQERILELFALSPELENNFCSGDEAFCSRVEQYCLDDNNEISIDAVKKLVDTQNTAWSRIGNNATTGTIDLMPLEEVYTSDLGAQCDIAIKQQEQEEMQDINYFEAEKATAKFLEADFDLPIRLNNFQGELYKYLNGIFQCTDVDIAELADNNIQHIQAVIDLDNRLYSIAQQHFYLTRIGEYKDNKRQQEEIPELAHQEEYDIFDNPEPILDNNLLDTVTYHVPESLDDKSDINISSQGIIADLSSNNSISTMGLYDMLTTATSEDFGTEEDEEDAELDDILLEDNEQETNIFDEEPEDLDEDSEGELDDKDEIFDDEEDRLIDEPDEYPSDDFDEPDEQGILGDDFDDPSDEDFEADFDEAEPSEEAFDDEDDEDVWLDDADEDFDEEEEVQDDTEDSLEDAIKQYADNDADNTGFDLFLDEDTEYTEGITQADISDILSKQADPDESDEDFDELDEEEDASDEDFDELDDADEDFDGEFDDQDDELDEEEDDFDELDDQDDELDEEEDDFDELDEEEDESDEDFDDFDDFDDQPDEPDESLEDQDEDFDDPEEDFDDEEDTFAGASVIRQGTITDADDEFDDPDEFFSAEDFEDDLTDINGDSNADFDDPPDDNDFDDFPDDELSEEGITDESDFDDFPDDESSEEDFDDFPDDSESDEEDFDDIPDEEDTSQEEDFDTDAEFDEPPDEDDTGGNDIFDFLDDDEELDESIFEPDEDNVLSLDNMLSEDIEQARQADEDARQYNPLSGTDMGIPASAMRAPQTPEEKNQATANSILSLYNKLARSPKVAMQALSGIFHHG